ncbi:MAG: SEL1-like repeat protein [Acidobacteria bacterium]|nr:SEL1-like repeat protein [Acidobacteriota bacterium]
MARRPHATSHAAAVPREHGHAALIALPLLPIAGIFSFAMLPRIHANPTLLWSFMSAGGVLLAWWVLLALSSRGRALRTQYLLRPEHYMQMVAQGAIYTYWAIYWDPIRDAAALIAAQIVFAYAFDWLLSWSRRDTTILSFGAFPIIFSTNLFLRFRDDYFALQFVLVAVAFLAKEFLRWNKDGRRVHIFNPSSFPLAVASLLLLATGTTDITWGVDIARQLFQPPHIYLFLFLISLPGQYKFGVTTMSLSAVLTTYLFGLAYFGVTGTYFFVDSYIPVAVFLGMLLLFVDPATSPRTELGRVIFGALYGASTVALYGVLTAFGAPGFYDKLLQIPILNLSIQLIDRAAGSRALAWLDPARLGRSWQPARRRLAYTSTWVVVFIVMALTQGVGDAHPGNFIPFWQQACADGRRNACRQLDVMVATACKDGSGWACNEFGLRVAVEQPPAPQVMAAAFTRACGFGSGAGCANAAAATSDIARLRDDAPNVDDYRVLLRIGKGAITDPPAGVYQRACDQGWLDGCEALAFAFKNGTPPLPRDAQRAIALLEKTCAAGNASACFNAAAMYHNGDGLPADEKRAQEYLRKACDGKFLRACDMLATASTASHD